MDCMRMNTEYLGYSAGSPVIHGFGRLYKVLARRINHDSYSLLLAPQRYILIFCIIYMCMPARRNLL